MTTTGFTSNSNKGFQITFENGWTISVQFGPGSYSSVRNLTSYQEFDKPMQTPNWSSPDAEIAIWDKDGEWYNFGSDVVKGHVTPNEVAEWIDKISKWTKFSVIS